MTALLSPLHEVDKSAPTCSNANANVIVEDGRAERYVPVGRMGEIALILNSYAAVTRPNRQEQKIRNLDIKIGRYITTHPLPLQHPPSCPRAADGDLYIHHYGNKKVQIWLREGDGWLGDITDGHDHPLLSDYRLFVADDVEPTWVTRKTRSTYKGRIRGHQKQVN